MAAKSLEGRAVQPYSVGHGADLREIEVMMLYTPQSKAMAGNAAAMEAQLLLSIEEANIAMGNSDTGVRFRVVHTAETDYEASGDLWLDLDRLQSPSDGVMDEVHAWRQRYKADLVCLVVESAQGYSGLGKFATGPEGGFSVVAMPFLTGYYSVAHELGHNLGCDHDRDNAVSGGAFPFSYGYRFDADGIRYRTVMAYPPGWRIPYFSNPEITFKGEPTGVPLGQTDEADNARTIRMMAPFVDSYGGLSVELTGVSDGASVSPAEPLELAARVTSDEGHVVGVEFVDGDIVLGEAKAPPYRFSWTTPTAGQHILSTQVRAAEGVVLRSRGIGITVRTVNDAFADRLRLFGSNVVGSAVLENASSEPAEPLQVRNIGVSVWWTWTAPVTGLVRVSASRLGMLKVGAWVFSGSTLEELRVVEASRVSSRDLVFYATANQSYQICVAGSAASVPVLVYLTTQAPPANDDFAKAEPVEGFSGTINGSTVGASAEPGEPSIGSTRFEHSVWFRWSPPSAGLVKITLTNGVAGTDYSIFSGVALESLTVVATSATARDGFRVEAKQNYFIAVDGAFQDFSLSFSLASFSGNDDFAKRASAAINGLLTINPGTASLEPNEPAHGEARGGHSQWWSWRAPSNGGVRMARQRTGNTFPPHLAVAWYTGTAFTNLVRVASHDFTNYNSPNYAIDYSDTLVFPVRAGTNYVIALESADGPNQRVKLEFQGDWSNNNFKQRRVLTTGSITGTTLGATAEVNEPAHGGEPPAHSIWWTWSTPTTELVTVSIDGTGETLPRLSIYTGEALTNLVTVAENSFSGEIWPNITFTAVAGQRYLLAIDERTSGYSYSLLFKNPTAPDNDDFLRAEKLPPEPVSRNGSTLAATSEPGEAELSGRGGSASVWYAWSTPTERNFAVLASGTRAGGTSQILAMLPDPVVAVYEGASLASLTQIASGVGSVVFRAHRNGKYFFAVTTPSDYGEEFVVNFITSPTYDQFANALPLSESIAALGLSRAQLRAATSEPGEPNHAGHASGHSLWFKWTPARAGRYLWNNSESYYTTIGRPMRLVTAVYTGAGTDLAGLIVVASNQWSSVSFSAEVGKRYYLALDLEDPQISFSGGVAVSLTAYPALLAPRLGADEEIEFSFDGTLGQSFSVEASGDLLHWEPIRQIIISSGAFHYTEPTSLLIPKKFFRVIQNR